MLQGVELGTISAPLHRIHIDSDLVTGPVIVGIRPTLPIKSISMILGNDLAEEGIRPDPIVTNLLNENNGSDEKKTRPIPGLCRYTSHGKRHAESDADLYISSEGAGSGNRSYAK